jgi:hypothetical protein
MPDSFYGGKEDLTSALGYEEDGTTTIIFRKKLEGIFSLFIFHFLTLFISIYGSFPSSTTQTSSVIVNIIFVSHHSKTVKHDFVTYVSA